MLALFLMRCFLALYFFMLDGECSEQMQGCADSPCPEGSRCVPLQEYNKYRCICPWGKNEKCSGNLQHFLKIHLLPATHKKSSLIPATAGVEFWKEVGLCNQ